MSPAIIKLRALELLAKKCAEKAKFHSDEAGCLLEQIRTLAKK